MPSAFAASSSGITSDDVHDVSAGRPLIWYLMSSAILEFFYGFSDFGWNSLMLRKLPHPVCRWNFSIG